MRWLKPQPLGTCMQLYDNLHVIAIFYCLSIFGVNSPQKLRSIVTSDYPTDAKRPAYSVLSCKSIHDKFDVEQPNLDVAINSALKKILADKL